MRLAAARSALSCLARWTPDWDVPAGSRPRRGHRRCLGRDAGPIGGAGPRRRAAPCPRAAQFALDHARLLAPLGSIPDARERRAILADLADDLLAPIGTVVTPSGLRHGRSAGALLLHGVNGGRSHDLRPGGLELVELPPGATAVAEFRFNDAVRLGGRGRHFAIDVTGGLGGLLVDLRDVPLRLPDRAEMRGELLEAWQAAVLTGREA